jgi:hypothetical protein
MTIVLVTWQRNIGWSDRAHAERMPVVELEPDRAGTVALLVHVPHDPVPLVDGPDGSRDVSRGGSLGTRRPLASGRRGACTAKRRASSRSSVSETAASMTVARSASGIDERTRAWSLSSLSRSAALAVNWTL